MREAWWLFEAWLRERSQLDFTLSENCWSVSGPSGRRLRRLFGQGHSVEQMLLAANGSPGRMVEPGRMTELFQTVVRRTGREFTIKSGDEGCALLWNDSYGRRWSLVARSVREAVEQAAAGAQATAVEKSDLQQKLDRDLERMFNIVLSYGPAGASWKTIREAFSGKGYSGYALLLRSQLIDRGLVQPEPSASSPQWLRPKPRGD